jgi:GntR family transcriptional repressor for pyruvate dehydrogenase complex
MDNLSPNFARIQIFKEVKTEKVYIRVVKQIEELIENGKLKPGDRLPPEKILAKKLGVSRPSIREAIVALEILGFVETRGGRGNFVKDVVNASVLDQGFRNLEEEESPFELLQARKIIEGEIAGYAARMAEEEDLRRIRQSLDNMRNMAHEPSNPEKFDQHVKLDLEFHLSIARATHNAVLLRMVTQLFESLKEDLWTSFKKKSWGIPGILQRYFKEHEQIFSAIEAQQSYQARKSMHKHLTGVQKDLFGKLRD